MERLENNLKDEKRTEDEEFLSNSLLVVSLVSSVLTGLVCLVLNFILSFKLKKYQRALLFLVPGLILLAIRFFMGGLATETIFEIPLVKELYSIFETFKATFHPKGSWNFLTTFTLLSNGLSLTFFGLFVSTQESTQQQQLDEIRKDEETKHQKSLSSDKVLDTKSRAHLFAIGTTGSGKTANILRYVENSIKNGQPTIIVDGKGGTKEHDLATISQKLMLKNTVEQCI